jgi:hypothetical protein
MTTTDPKEIGGARRQRYNLRRHRQSTIGLSMAALVFGVVYLAVAVVLSPYCSCGSGNLSYPGGCPFRCSM